MVSRCCSLHGSPMSWPVSLKVEEKLLVMLMIRIFVGILDGWSVSLDKVWGWGLLSIDSPHPFLLTLILFSWKRVHGLSHGIEP